VSATLSSWYVFNVAEREFKYLKVSPKNDSWMYGWGFSFVYTRLAWETFPFPNATLSEDYEFMSGLRLSQKAVFVTVVGEHGHCAHTYHPKVSVSGGEQTSKGQCLGVEVPAPSTLVDLLPLLLQAEGMTTRAHRHARYFVTGSWNKWDQLLELLPINRSPLYEATIPVYEPPQMVEFQIIADSNWALTFYPDRRPEAMAKGKALGPWRCHGVNFSVEVPKEWFAVAVQWNSEEQRVSYTLRKSFPMSYFLVGNWSNWHRFDSLIGKPGTGTAFACTVVGLTTDAYFQVVQDSNWDLRFWPARGDMGRILGPGKPPDDWMTWHVPRPEQCKSYELKVLWEPAGPQISWNVHITPAWHP